MEELVERLREIGKKAEEVAEVLELEVPDPLDQGTEAELHERLREIREKVEALAEVVERAIWES